MSNRSSLAHFLQQAIFIAFNLLFFMTPFIFTWMNQELFEFSKMLFVYAATIIILGLWALRMAVEQKIIVKGSPLDYFLLAFLLSQVISTVFSLHLRTSWFGYYTRFNGGLLSTLSYITLFYAMIANLKKSQLPAIFSSLLLSMLLVSWYAIPEHFGHSPSCWLITQKFDVACWVQDVQNRVFATFGQPNWLATFLIALIPLNVDYLLREKKWLNRFYLLAILLSSVSALLFSKSRSGLLGLALGLAFYGVAKIWQAKQNKSPQFKKLSVVASLIALLIILIGTPYTPSFNELVNGQGKVLVSPTPAPEIQVGGTPSEEIRKIVWQGAIKIWQRYPIFGSGVETFAYSYYLDRPATHNLVSEWDFLYNKAHNELLNLLANTGLVGLLSYLALMGAAFYFGRKSVAILAGLVAMFVANFFGFSTVMSNLLLFGFLAMIVLQNQDQKKQIINKNSDIKKIDKKENIDNKEYYIYSTIVLATLLLLGRVHAIWQADYLFTKGQNAFTQGNYQVGLPLIQEAILKSPKEAFFYDELADNYAQLSIAYANEKQSTASSQLAQSAIESNRKAIELNDAHLNFYKSQARIYIRLGQLDQRLYSYAKQALEKAISLSPTDAKLYYNLALVLEIMGQSDEALVKMEYAVEIKSNYLQARGELARMYFTRNELEKAKAQYVYSLEKIAPNDELVKEKLKIVEASLSAQKQK